ncbi:hypothetical protein TRIUR3_03581 [Triticum urartu]|uniref:Uncharacterized protein n=1 Tax=Triticum urartu TaxID=4572 RepID=M8AIM4_TRIUA|nr:hypothetical protein TRIUR3_03581 [Triticum urartu]
MPVGGSLLVALHASVPAAEVGGTEGVRWGGQPSIPGASQMPFRLFLVFAHFLINFCQELTDIDGFGAGGIFLCRFTGTPTFGAFFGCFPSALACDDTFEVHKAAKIARTTKSLSSFMLA